LNAKKNPADAVGAAGGANHVALAGVAVKNSLSLTPELQAHIDRVVAAAPIFNPVQRSLVASLLGGDR